MMVTVLMKGFCALWCFLLLVRALKPDPEYLKAEEWDGIIRGITVYEEKKKFASWNRNSDAS